MEQSPTLEDNSLSASKDIQGISWNTKFHYLSHKRPPPAVIMSQVNPFHTLPPYLIKICFNVILPSAPGTYSRDLELRFRSGDLPF
jgi:hypothetical protein